MRCRFTAGLLTVTLAASIVALGAPAARASSKGRKNTAYYGRSGYPNGRSGYYGDNGCPQQGGSYTTDECGNRHYYDSRYSDGYHRYASSYSSTADRGRNCPPGQYHGRQRGRR